MSLAYVAYQAAAWVSLALGGPFVAWKALVDPRYRVGWGERLGRWAPLGPPPPVWVHGASVGEMRAAAPLTARLREGGARLLLTTTSPSGREAAFGLAGPGGAARILPLDLAPLHRRAVRAAAPRALVIVETELWPALLREAARAGVPALLVNARISDRTFPRYRRLRRWVGPLLATFDGIQAQSAEDARRFLALGAPSSRVLVGGNLKFDLAAPDPADPDVAALRRAHAGGWRAVVGGSTHPGEEEALLAALGALEGAGLRAGLVLAPRHLERLAAVEAAVRAAGRESVRWGDLCPGGAPREVGILDAFEARRVVLVDRYGLLSKLYGAADAAFVGGSLSPVGGHNLLEPLNWGVPVAFGPHMENARDIRDEVVRRSLGAEVADAAGLGETLAAWLADAGHGAEVRRGAAEFFRAHRGAVDRAVVALRGLGALGEAG